MSYDNTNTGALFKNENKTTDNQPDYRGSIFLPDGVEKDLAAWIKTSKAGKKYMSLKLSDKYVKEVPIYQQQARKDLPPGFTESLDMSDDAFNDDIPF